MQLVIFSDTTILLSFFLCFVTNITYNKITILNIELNKLGVYPIPLYRMINLVCKGEVRSRRNSHSARERECQLSQLTESAVVLHYLHKLLNIEYLHRRQKKRLEVVSSVLCSLTNHFKRVALPSSTLPPPCIQCTYKVLIAI